jgi:hypothetical protein
VSKEFDDFINSLTEEERVLFFFVPNFVRGNVAGVDGNLDKKEIAAMMDSAVESVSIDDSYERTLETYAPQMAAFETKQMIEMGNNPDAYVTLFEDLTKRFGEILNRAPGGLQAKVRDSLVRSLVTVAEASGGGFMGMGDKIDQSERNIIKVILGNVGIQVTDPAIRKKLKLG